jgi:hypothetical protein
VVRSPQPISAASPGAVERCYPLYASAGDGQLRANHGTGDAVQHQVPGPVADGGGNVVERCLSDPGGEPAGRPGRIRGEMCLLSPVLTGCGCSHGIPRFRSIRHAGKFLGQPESVWSHVGPVVRSRSVIGAVRSQCARSAVLRGRPHDADQDEGCPDLGILRAREQVGTGSLAHLRGLQDRSSYSAASLTKPVRSRSRAGSEQAVHLVPPQGTLSAG